MSIQENKIEICPLCHRRCSLSDPMCGRGRAYAQSAAAREKRADTESSAMTAKETEPENQESSGDADSRLMHLLHRSFRLTHHRRGPQHGRGRILSILLEKGAMTQHELMDLVEVRSSSMSEILTKMESEGYISRERSEEDKRNVNIRLTESGVAAAKGQEQSNGQEEKEFFSALNEEEKKQLEALLSKVLASWKGEERHQPYGRGHHGNGGEDGYHHGDGAGRHMRDRGEGRHRREDGEGPHRHGEGHFGRHSGRHMRH